MKFKKGDMVRVIKRQNPWGWSPKMQEMLDSGHAYMAWKTGMICSEYHVELKCGDEYFLFPPSALEHAEKKREWPADWADFHGSDLDFLDTFRYEKMTQTEALEHAIGVLKRNISCMDRKNYGPQISAHETAIEQMQEVLDGLEQEQSMSQYEWTEQDYRECCGVWGGNNGDGLPILVNPERLHTSCNRESFDESVDGLVRIEPMPDKCMPVSRQYSPPVNAANKDMISRAVARYPTGSSCPVKGETIRIGYRFGKTHKLNKWKSENNGWFSQFPEKTMSTSEAIDRYPRQTEWD